MAPSTDPAKRAWDKSNLLCLRPAHPVSSEPIPDGDVFCVSDPVVSRLIRELAPKHPEIGAAAAVWLNSGKRLGYKPGEIDLGGPGYAIHARYVANMVRWCANLVSEGRSRLLPIAWHALYGTKPFDRTRLAGVLIPEIEALAQYCEAAAGRGEALVASMRPSRRQQGPRPSRRVPAVWQEVIREGAPSEWTLYSPSRARGAVFDDGRYLLLAERERGRGEREYVFCRTEPATDTLYWSQDALSLTPIEGDIRAFLERRSQAGRRTSGCS